MPIVRPRGFDFNYTELGSPDSRPIVLLHGATETFDSGWRNVAPRLRDRFRVIGPDLRGHGKSDNPEDRLDLRSMADDVAALLDVLQLESAHICGFSGGASTGLFFGLRHPTRTRTLTLISNNARRDEARSNSAFWSPERLAGDDPLWLEAMNRSHSVPPQRILGWWAEEDRFRPDFTAEELSTIEAPTLIVAGDRDPIIPLEQSVFLYSSLRDARFCVVPGVGHGATHRAAPLIERVIMQFVDEFEPEDRIAGA